MKRPLRKYIKNPVILNISYPKSYKQKEISSYRLDENISQGTIIRNLNSNKGPEFHLQKIYGDEIT